MFGFVFSVKYICCLKHNQFIVVSNIINISPFGLFLFFKRKKDKENHDYESQKSLRMKNRTIRYRRD
jgi:hypothetical protein